MQVKDILNLACNYLGLEELLESEYFVDGGEQLTTQNTKVLNKEQKKQANKYLNENKDKIKKELE